MATRPMGRCVAIVWCALMMGAAMFASVRLVKCGQRMALWYDHVCCMVDTKRSLVFKGTCLGVSVRRMSWRA
eukprot:2442497-Alexandrium_andersonii.AAC.1